MWIDRIYYLALGLRLMWMFLLSLRAFLENPIKLQSRPDHSSLTPHQTDFLPSSVIRCPGISWKYRVISNNAKFSPPVQQSRKTQLGHLAAEREGWSQLYSFYTSALAYKCTLRWSHPNIGAQSKYLFITSVQCNANWNWWPRLLLLVVLWQFPFEMSCKLS